MSDKDNADPPEVGATSIWHVSWGKPYKPARTPIGRLWRRFTATLRRVPDAWAVLRGWAYAEYPSEDY